MTNLRLVLKTSRIKPPPTTKTYDAETIASHLKVHLTGSETLNIHNHWAEIGKEDSHALDVDYQAKLADLGQKREELERTVAGLRTAAKAAEAIEEEIMDMQRRHATALTEKAHWEMAMFAAHDDVKEAEKNAGPSKGRKPE
ncbi:MAG: hypothetical protein LQ346_000467 [Caloplaca aetnensis]|nr:MAG: hypothetical protein LQ346_000467 [Caloplaca aetnensis]